ncbi:MAG: hypothetical protein R3B48_06455 [Kofleriaceae bacterium]
MPRAKKLMDEDAIAEAVQKLKPEEAEYFLHKLERAIARRRMQLLGYLAALGVWAVTMFFALAYYGAAGPESFRAWALTLPFAAVGVVLWIMGGLADRVGRAPPRPRAPASAAEPPAGRDLGA